MNKETYPFKVKPLPYDRDALMPVINEQTLYFHHDKHYSTYVDNLNSALTNHPELQNKSLVELITNIECLPLESRVAVRNNGGGVYNHELYFDCMNKPEAGEAKGKLMDAIVRDFGSYDRWREQMKLAAVSKFGSGWAWLISDKKGRLAIVQTANQDVPDLLEYTPILIVDVWEHAYYLQYQNRRAEYVEGWFRLIDWNKALERYEKATKC